MQIDETIILHYDWANIGKKKDYNRIRHINVPILFCIGVLPDILLFYCQQQTSTANNHKIQRFITAYFK